MWSSRHQEDATADPAAVWAALAAVHGGTLTVAGHEAYEADGTLQVGAVVRAIHDGFRGPDMTVVEWEPGRRYAHEFALRRYVVRLGYTVEPTDTGARLIRTIGITGPLADLATAGLGQQLTAVYAPQVRALADAAG